MASFAHALLKYSGVTGAAVRWQARRLPILMYHGLCPDEWAGEPWMPSYFTSLGRFTEQMRFLRERLCPMELVEAVRALAANRRHRHAAVVTFDGRLCEQCDPGPRRCSGILGYRRPHSWHGHLSSVGCTKPIALRLIRYWQRQAGEATRCHHGP